jgi:hypothetical protein
VTSRTAVSIRSAVPADFDRIAALTAGVYTAEGFASPAYAAELADVTGRATRARLLVAADEQQRIVGSVALVLEGDLGEVTRNPRRPRSGCWWSTRRPGAAGWARRWCASAWSRRSRPAGR